MDKQKECYLFFDLDGTVFVDGQIPEENMRAMLAAQAAGHKLILNTGRSYGTLMLVKHALAVPWDGMILGAGDIRFGGEFLWQNALPEKMLLGWLDFCMEKRFAFGYEGETDFFCLNFSERTTKLLGLPIGDGLRELSSDEKDAYRKQVLTEMREKGNRATKLSIFERKECFDNMELPSKRKDIVFHPYYAEVFAPGCDKGSAIRKFCELKDVSIEQCVCFGDSLNDCGMFRECPTSICMDISPEELDRMSTYRAKTKYGVAEGILWLFGEEIFLTN